MELPRRPGRDTDIEVPNDPRYSDGIPARSGTDSIQPLPPPPKTTTGDRISAVGAATLPPARPIARPPTRQAISPPAVVSRPQTNDNVRSRGDSDAVDIYAAASADAPPGAQGERAGQYAQHKRISTRVPVDVVKGGADRSGPVPIPSGLARPGRTPSASPPSPGSGGVPQRVARELSPQPQTQPIHTMPRAGTPSPSSPYRGEPGSRPERARTPTPARVSAPPTASRSPSSQSGGVVMTRPAVIVGAPAKPAAPKVRKAREEEGRGFGQGLISEKSLDEVILAYLSEDADEK